MTKKRLLTAVLIGFGLLACSLIGGERLGGIYLGDTVGPINGAGQDIAVWISYDGTVNVFMGAHVPSIHTPDGGEVYVRKVIVVRRESSKK